MARQAKINSKAYTIIEAYGQLLPYPVSLVRPSRKKRSRRTQQRTMSDAALHASAPAVPDRKNPIWGDDKPLSMQETAAFVGMPLGTLRQKVYRREIESVLVGRERKIQPSAMRAYLEGHKRPAL